MGAPLSEPSPFTKPCDALDIVIGENWGVDSLPFHSTRRPFAATARSTS